MAYGSSLANPTQDLVYCFQSFSDTRTSQKGETYGKECRIYPAGYGLCGRKCTVTQSILADRKVVCAEFLKNVQGKEFDKILLFGIGSSYNAGLMVKPLLESALQLDVLVASPAMYEQMCRNGQSFGNAL